MSKIMIWVGQFDSEADVEKYMDQSAFRQWWKDYDEDNKELRCQFCKELGVMNYDEDFLIMKFTSDGLAGLLNLIPADTQKISLSMADKILQWQMLLSAIIVVRVYLLRRQRMPQP